MLTVYGDVCSGNCLKVKWLLDFLRIDYSWSHADIVARAPDGDFDLTPYAAVRRCIERVERVFGIGS